MTPTDVLRASLFNSREPLYFDKSDQDVSGLSSRSARDPTTRLWTRTYFECGQVQAPRFGSRLVFVEQSNRFSDDETRCSRVLSDIKTLMEDEVKKHPEQLKKFDHPDTTYNWESFWMRAAAWTVTTTKAIVVDPPVKVLYATIIGGDQNTQAHRFDLNSEHEYRLRTNLSGVFNNARPDDVLCGEVVVEGASHVVYSPNVALCNELQEFVEFSAGLPLRPKFPQIDKTFKATDQSAK